MLGMDREESSGDFIYSVASLGRGMSLRIKWVVGST